MEVLNIDVQFFLNTIRKFPNCRIMNYGNQNLAVEIVREDDNLFSIRFCYWIRLIGFPGIHPSASSLMHDSISSRRNLSYQPHIFILNVLKMETFSRFQLRYKQIFCLQKIILIQ